MHFKFVCLGCGKEKPSAPRSVGRQSYCGEKVCQKTRKAVWQRQKLARDSDYVANQRRCYEAWRRAPIQIIGDNTETTIPSKESVIACCKDGATYGDGL